MISTKLSGYINHKRFYSWSGLYKYYLHKVKLCSECQLYSTYPETTRHLLSDCKETKELWKNVKYWFLSRTGIPFTFMETVKILGYTNYDQNFWPINFNILPVINFYYFSNRCKALHLLLLKMKATTEYFSITKRN